MKKKQMLAALMGAAMLSTLLAGCGGGDKEGSSEEGGVKEFTAFFAVPGTEINDDNEIQQKIAEITGAKCKETWLTGQTAEEAVGTMIAGGEYPDFIDGGDGMAQLTGIFIGSISSRTFTERKRRRLIMTKRSGSRPESWSGLAIRK